GLHLDHVDANDLDLEELLDGLADLRLVRVLVHLERVLARDRRRVALLRDDRREQDLRGVHQLALPSTSSSADSLTSSERAHTTAAISRSLGATTATRSRLRKLLTRFTTLSVATSTSGEQRPAVDTNAFALFVDGASNSPTTANDPPETCAASALRIAAFTALRFTFCVNVRGVFANA